MSAVNSTSMHGALPPDRGHVDTEQRNQLSGDFDQLATIDQVRLMVQDHEAVTRALTEASAGLAAFIDAVQARFLRGGRLVYCGAGTSGRLGVLDASECPPTFCSDPEQVQGIIAGGDSALRRSSERMEDDFQGVAPEFERIGMCERDTLLAIAAGGTTPFALGAIALAKSKGALTGFLVCTHCPKPASCDHLLDLATGAEILTGSTRLKAGSATKLALNCITTILFTRLGKVHGNLMVDLAATNDKLVDRAIRTLRLFDESLSRNEAAQYLHAAGGRLKVAILMHSLKLTATAASSLLDTCNGNLRLALCGRAG